MKRISNVLVVFLMVLGLVATIIMPIYLMIASACLRDIIPQWFLTLNFILSIFMIVLITSLFLISIFEDDRKKNK